MLCCEMCDPFWVIIWVMGYYLVYFCQSMHWVKYSWVIYSQWLKYISPTKISWPNTLVVFEHQHVTHNHVDLSPPFKIFVTPNRKILYIIKYFHESALFVAVKHFTTQVSTTSIFSAWTPTCLKFPRKL